MGLKHVLIVGYPSADLANIEYLLQLGGCKVTVVRDVNEAVRCLLGKHYFARNLDLILMSNCLILMHFVELFNGAIRLSRRFPILVIDDLRFMPRVRTLLEDDLENYDVHCCTHGEVVQRLEQMCELSLRDVLSA